MKQLFTLVLCVVIHTQVHSQSVPSYVPTNGLVGWWGFNGNAQDGSGNGNHGTVNGATLTTDRFGNQDGAYSFDGDDDYIISNGGSLFISNNLTFSFWIYRFNNEFSNGEFICLGSPHSTYFGVISSPLGSRINYARGCGETTVNNSPSIYGLNVWNHLVLVGSMASGQTQVYVNGLFVGIATNSTPSNCSNTNLYFGNDIHGLSEFFNGKLDDIGIWNRALSQQEITNLYNAQSCQDTVTSQPQNQSTSPNRNVTFSLSSSDSNSTYQWQTDMGFGFQNLTNAGQYSGVTTSSLTVSNTSLQNNNQLFRCIVSTTQCGRDTSDVVTLSVNSSSSTTNIPKRFNYQSVIRDTSGVLVTNRTIGLKVTLSRGPQLGDLYSETHQLTSNSNGLITSCIGGGIPVLGSMDSIDWSLGDVYIKTEVDVMGERTMWC